MNGVPETVEEMEGSNSAVPEERGFDAPEVAELDARKKLKPLSLHGWILGPKQRRGSHFCECFGLNPEKRCDPRTASNRAHLMKAFGSVEDQMPSGGFYAAKPIGVLQDKFAALILVWFRKEQSCRKISANPVTRPGQPAYRVVRLRGRGGASLVPVELRLKNPYKLNRGTKQKALFESFEDHCTHRLSRRRILCEPPIAIFAGPRTPRRDSRATPIRGGEQVLRAC